MHSNDCLLLINTQKGEKIKSMKFIKKSFLLTLMFIAFAVTLVSCVLPGTGTQTKIELTPVKDEIDVQLGDAFYLEFSATENDTYKEADILANLKYESSDKTVVNVEKDGLVAVGVGSATITATWKEDTTVQATVKVNVVARLIGQVTFSATPGKIYVGEYFVIDYQAEEDVILTFTSSNPEVLACEENKFDGIAAGSATITAVASNGYNEKEYKWNIVVENGEFTITYVLDGGKNSSANPDKYDASNLPLTLGRATKTNMKFVGWSLEEGSTEYITELPAGTTGNITLYANYENIVRKITYELDGGVLPEDAPVSFVQGEGVELVPATKEGYIFLGWKTAASAVNYVTKVEASRKTDIKLYAIWEKIPVYSSIVYELNDGVLPEGYATQYQEGVEFTLPIPSKENYRFLGWTKEVSSENYIRAIPADATGTFKVYAQWKEKPFVTGSVYVGEGKDFATLDEAILGAAEGSNIILAPGEYTLSVVINKSFTIVGPNAELDVSQFAKEEAVINIAKDISGNLAAPRIIFNGVHLKGTGGGGGVPGISFQDGGSMEYLEFTSCVISDTNTFIKFVGGTSNVDVLIKNSQIHTVGQFIIWTTSSLKKLTLMGNLIQGNTCGAVTNAAAALFRIRFGEVEALGNYFDGNSYNEPGYFELSDAAGNSVVKYNTFNNVTKLVYTSKDNNVVFNENLYLDNSGNALAAAPSELKANGLTADTVVCDSEQERATLYLKELSALYPGRYYLIEYELSDGELTSTAPSAYDTETGVTVLPTIVREGFVFVGWYMNGQLIECIPAGTTGNIKLVAQFKELEGEIYTIEYVTNKNNVIWPSRPANNRQEIIDALYADLYEWAKGNGETKSYTEYVAYIEKEFAAYNDIKLRNTKLGNYPAEDGSTEYFLNIPEYFQKWSEFFAVFNTAMLAVNAEQSFYTDTYATMVRINQFVTWSSTGEKYFASHLSKLCAATKVPQEIVNSYRNGQTIVLPNISLSNGLQFLGWYDNAEFNGDPIAKITATTGGSNKVFYAKWAEEVKPESIEINKINEILLFESHQLVWSLTPSNVTDPSVEFFSSNEAVAKVSGKGLITTFANGTTTITVKVYGNRELDVVFELVVYTDDYIDGSYETNSYAVIDESVKLNAEVIYKNGTTGAVVWSSLTPEIATVDANGIVTALNEGIAKIVAADAKNPETKLEFVVTVLAEAPEGVLDLAVRSNESNVFTRYDLNIGSTYNKDILGSVSKLFGNGKLVKNDKYYESSNTSPATYGVMDSIEFITVHYTGNMAAGADAAANASYFATNGTTSIHYTTGNDGAYYCMDESKGAWHAGDSGALAQVGEFKWMSTGVKVGLNDPKYHNIKISDDFYYEINGQKTTVKMPSPWNYSNRNTDHVLNADGTISSKAGYSTTGFTNRTPESFINDQGLPFKVENGEYYMGTTWWCYTQVYEGRICGTGGNRNSIGIESCVNEGSDLWWTWQLTAQLVADIMVRQNLDITRVRGHHFFSGKNCPQPMLENDLEIWYEFLELVEAEYELLTKFAGYEVSIVSNNPDIVDNDGRVVNQPNTTTAVTYTITFTKDGESESITLASMVKGRYVGR